MRMSITNPWRFVVFCMVIVLIVGGLVLWLVSDQTLPEEHQPSMQSTQVVPPSPIPLVVYLTAQDQEGKSVDVECRAGKCQRVLAAVHYAAASTSLVAPRDYLASPNGRYTAYWLDNIADPEAQLTELWLYDAQEKSTRLLVENIFVPDVRSAVHWNQSSTHLWFTGNTAPPDRPEKLELIIVVIDPPSRSARALPKSEVVDVSPAGKKLVLADPKISWLRFLGEETQLYAVADTAGFTIWRRTGSLASVIEQLSLRQLPAGLTNAKIRLIEFEAAEARESVLPFDDEELVAFIERHSQEITRVPSSALQRIIVTKQANAVFVDTATQRWLVVIKDLLNPEWYVLGQYKRSGFAWWRVGSTQAPEPTATRVYEWEAALKKWILKQDLDK